MATPSGPVHGLRHTVQAVDAVGGPFLADGRGRQHPERPGQHAGLVGEDVAEQVLHDHHVELRGAGDERTASRRMGLAWARAKGVLFVATSERALALALDRSLSNEGFSAFLPGLVSMKLDLDALRKDLYFRREFL